MLFPDLVLGSQAIDIAHEFIQISDKRCSHCHRKIIGNVHQLGNRYYDDYCWQFRFINDNSDDKTDRIKEHLIGKRTDAL
ncbi:MAG: hypothetical protein QCI82_10975 [Candidatus Thermoplasmatota archaeon]|nr:hypothetical protein [Candidatus Thermoplasmatota archaeon]